MSGEYLMAYTIHYASVIENSYMQKLIDNAEIVIDPLENLIERVEANIGEAYKPDVLDELAVLKHEDLAAYMTLRAQLKKSALVR